MCIMQCGRILSAYDMVVYSSTFELILWEQKNVELAESGQIIRH